MAGFTLANVVPVLDSTSFPSISISGSGFTCAVSAMDRISLPSHGGVTADVLAALGGRPTIIAL